MLERFASEAIRLGADEIEIEYRDGNKHLFAMKNGNGVGIGRLPSSAPEATALRDELRTITGANALSSSTTFKSSCAPPRLTPSARLLSG